MSSFFGWLRIVCTYGSIFATLRGALEVVLDDLVEVVLLARRNRASLDGRRDAEDEAVGHWCAVLPLAAAERKLLVATRQRQRVS